MKRALVMGVGNLLLSDEGFGVHVVREFEKRYRVPPEVEVVDGGCVGFALTDYLREKDLALLIDVIASPAPPGHYRVLTARELEEFPTLGLQSCHQVSLVEALKFAEFAGLRPESFRVFAVVPEKIAPGLELSATLQKIVPVALDWLVHQLQTAGFELKPCA